MKMLLTGFEPFGGSQINPSEQVVRTLARDGIPGVALHSTILPVDRQSGPATLLNAVRACQPDAILCLGEVARRTAISIERVALNLALRGWRAAPPPKDTKNIPKAVVRYELVNVTIPPVFRSPGRHNDHSVDS